MRMLLTSMGVLAACLLREQSAAAQTIPSDVLSALVDPVREELPPGRIALDPRIVCKGPSCTSVWAGEHGSKVADDLSRLLSARLSRIEGVRRCEDRPGTCVLTDAEAVLALSAARIVGDTAIVVARIWIDGARNNLPRMVEKDVEIVLHRTPEGWQLARKGIVRIT